MREESDLLAIPTPFPTAGIPPFAKNPFISNALITINPLAFAPRLQSSYCPLTRAIGTRSLMAVLAESRQFAHAKHGFTDGTVTLRPHGRARRNRSRTPPERRTGLYGLKDSQFVLYGFGDNGFLTGKASEDFCASEPSVVPLQSPLLRHQSLKTSEAGRSRASSRFARYGSPALWREESLTCRTAIDTENHLTYERHPRDWYCRTGVRRRRKRIGRIPDAAPMSLPKFS